MEAVLIKTALIAGGINLLFHWLPWQAARGQPRPPRLVAYALGVIGIGIPFVVTLLGASTWESCAVVGLFAAVVAGGGIGTVFGYGVDKVLDYKNRAKDLAEQVALLEGKHDQDADNA